MRNTTQLKSIYAIQCKETKKLYIGSSTDVQMRARAHFSDLKRGAKTVKDLSGKLVNSQWQDDYNTYGKDSFDIFVIEQNIPYELSAVREDYYINLYKATSKEFGYNLIGAQIPNPLDLIYGLPKLPATQS